jgi:hypothetical protein
MFIIERPGAEVAWAAEKFTQAFSRSAERETAFLDGFPTAGHVVAGAGGSTEGESCTTGTAYDLGAEGCIILNRAGDYIRVTPSDALMGSLYQYTLYVTPGRRLGLIRSGKPGLVGLRLVVRQDRRYWEAADRCIREAFASIGARPYSSDQRRSPSW